MPKNYYIVLGIPKDSTQKEIKAAFRRLAKEYHPDRYGPEPAPFQVIQEAYSVLGDPGRRREYDRDMKRRGGQRFESRVRPAPRATAARPEPLVPEQNGESVVFGPGATQRYRFYHPGEDSFFDRIFGSLRDRREPSPRSSRSAGLTVRLTPGQAAAGGQAEVEVEVQATCPSCASGLRGGLYECWRCSGTGVVRGALPLLLSFPPNTPDGLVVDYVLDRYGMAGRLLSVRFEIG